MMATAAQPSLAELTRLFGRIGLINFGGPAGQIALMHKELVDDRGWISEQDYLHALNFCHLLPGPEAQQLATYVGWKLHGVKGGLAAGLLFVAPGALVMLLLSILYATAADLGWMQAIFLGIKAAVLAIVVQALLRIAGRSLDTGLKRGLAVAAFLGLALFNLPFPLIVLGAGLIGFVVALTKPEWLALSPSTAVIGPKPAIAPMIRTILIWGAIWAAPMVAVLAALGPDHVLWDVGAFFSKLAIVTFGGAYAVLSYMAQEAVQGYGWLQAREMADGLGLAETTPGPLIMVTQFVGFLAAYRMPEPFTPMVAGMIGAGLTTWVTFAPCFLWIFALAPWIDHLRSATRLRGALSALTASVVGVIANLTLWFALHVLFAQTELVEAGPLRVTLPLWGSYDGKAAILSILALILLFALKFGIFRMLGVMALGGLLLGFL